MAAGVTKTPLGIGHFVAVLRSMEGKGGSMSDDPKTGRIKVAVGSSEQAPFIYFDGVVTFGVNAGAIQLELAANTLVPDGAAIRTDVLITAHLRCSPAAAMSLRDSIDKALAMPARQQVIKPVPSSKPN
jgi:hypothetical protein